METNIIINSIGIVFTIIGATIMYLNSPINNSVSDGGNAFTDFDKIDKADKLRNRRLKNGLGFIVLGSILQLISNFVN